MKHKIVGVLIGFLIFVIFASLFGFNYTGFATLYLQENGNSVNYRIEKQGDFYQCLDSEPSNDIYNKGTCYSQLNTKNNIYGISSVDFCVGENSVVDYYCNAKMLCEEVVTDCPLNYVCSEGKCVEKFEPFSNFDIRGLAENFRNLFFR